MILLAIETTGPVSSVAVYRDGIISEIKNEENFSHLKELMPEVSAILKEENLDPKDIDAIAVSQGPGSFTGIRIGMVSAKGLAQVWDKPIVEVPTLASYAFRDYGWEDGRNILYCPVLDAKMHQVYAAAYKKNCEEPVIAPAAYQLEDYLALLSDAADNFDGAVFFGDAYKVYQTIMDEFGPLHAIAPDEDSYPAAVGVAELGAKLFGEGRVKSCFDAQPEYLRLPEAERKFRTKSMNLREAEEADLDRICEIEKAAFSDPWTKDMLRGEISVPGFVVAEDDGIQAFIICHCIPGVVAEVYDIATIPERRRQGIARRLLLDAIDRVKAQGVKDIQLEVRAGNTPAICLYESLGFIRTGLRTQYYQDGEDAILMNKEL